jgi:hypothetical protein
MPNGKPYTGNDGKYAPVHILSEIGKTTKLNPNGELCWSGFFIDTLLVALRPALAVIDPCEVELNETDTWEIIFWKAIVTLAKSAPGQPLNPMDVLNKADESAAVFFRIAPYKYVLVTSLSIVDLPAKSIQVRGCTISSLKERGKKFPPPKVLSRHLNGSAFAKHIKSAKYRLVKVTTEGRSKYDATERALNSLNLLRGLWSLFATYGSWPKRFGAPSRKPLGIIHAGPIHTLHFLDGKPADDNLYWYEPDFTEDQPIFQPAAGWEQLEKRRRRAMKRLAAVNYRQDLENLLIRYAEALDQPNTDIAFLQMWSILEKITDTIGGSYDETIKRTVWPFLNQDRLIAKNMLESLRYRRNQYVHSGKSGQESDQMAYMVKSFVDPHLLRLIFNPFNVHSLEKYGEFLALPTDATVLEQKKGMLTRALKVMQQAKDTI